MAATTALRNDTPADAHLVRARALGVALATLAAAGVWAVAMPLLGVNLVVRFGAGAPQTVGLGSVIGASLVASLCAWGLLAVLERRTSRARTIWTLAAFVVLPVSLSLPLTAGTTVSTRVALTLMHLAVAAVLIGSLRRA